MRAGGGGAPPPAAVVPDAACEFPERGSGGRYGRIDGHPVEDGRRVFGIKCRFAQLGLAILGIGVQFAAGNVEVDFTRRRLGDDGDGDDAQCLEKQALFEDQVGGLLL